MVTEPRPGEGAGSGAARLDATVVPAKVRPPRVRWLPRERLDELVPRLWEHRLTLVVAPPGSGKTTLLASWAAAAGVPVAWYRAESTDGGGLAVLACLHRALSAAVAGLPGGWTSAGDAAAALERLAQPRVLLVIDDLHTLIGSEAESTIEQLLDYAPPSLAVAAGSRTAPAFNLSRLRVSGELLEVTADDLRFRSWEVERLFRDFYGEALRADELARLARRTEGWAAGLQLFHLATQGKPPDERQRVLEGLGSSSRFVREYLTRNVVADLPEELRAFLVATSVLRRLTGPLCDALLQRTGSHALLEELERRGVFTVALDDEGTFRYHEVLRSHLEALLVSSTGEPAARAHAARAGGLLESAGAPAEALAAYSRAEDWASVDRLLADHGAGLAAGPSSWIDTLPPSLLVQDPWLTLATARRHRAEGRWGQAVEAYGRAETLFGGGAAGATCRRERMALAAWLDPMPAPGQGWTYDLRAAVARDPLGRRAAGPRPALISGPPDDVGGALAAGLAALLAGRVRDARRLLRDAAGDPAAAPVLAVAAGLGAAVAGLLAGDARAVGEVEGSVAAAERLGVGWLTRVGRAALATTRTPVDSEHGSADAAALLDVAMREDDRWGEGLCALAEGWAALGRPDRAIAHLELATARFRSLGAASLEAWARSLLACSLVRAGVPEARESAAAAEAFARTTGTPGPSGLAHLAMAAAGGDHAAELATLGRAILDDAGLAIPSAIEPGAGAHSGAVADSPAQREPVAVRIDGEAQPTDPPPWAHNGDAPAPVEIRCFGAFSISIAGRPLALASLKPRPRAILRMLALEGGRPVHREVLATAFWPEADGDTAARNLPVALSGLRRELEPGGGRGSGGILVREGDAYRLALPAHARVDLHVFEVAVAAGRAARSRGDHQAARAAFRAALAQYGGDLLPEDGPAEWVVGRRERARTECVAAAVALAELEMESNPGEAAAACAAGLAVDPYHDPLWRLLVEAREHSGDPAAARHARAGYRQMLAELGVAPVDAPA